MTNNDKKLSILLFVLSTTLVFGFTVDVYAFPAGDFEACLNAVGTVPCDTDGSGGSADEWHDGQITNEITYTEGQSIPARVDMTGLTGDGTTVHELEIFWHTTKANNAVSHTFDYITTFDNNDDPHPCLVAHNDGSDSICSGFGIDTIPIPDPAGNTNIGTVGGLSQPITAFTSLDSAEEQVFTMFAEGGTVDIKSIEYTLEESPTAQASTQLKITFTSTSTHVIAAYGAHLASPEDWDLTSSLVTGKPYQFGCVGVDGGGCTGKANLSSEGIIPLVNPTLTIIKDPTNNDGGDASPDDFNLTVNGNSVLSGIPNTYDSNTDLTLGETQLPGYAFVSVTGDDKCPASLNTAFQLAPGDDVTCTITNDDADAILTIIKDPTNNDGGDASPDDFNLTVNGNSVLSGIPNTYDSNTDLTLGETQLPGYAFVSVTGDDKCPASLNTAFQLAPGDDVTCTITNDDADAILTIIKDPTNNDGGDASPDDFNLTVNGNSVLSGIPNTYDSNTDLTLGETQLPGYAFVSVTGDDKCPASLNTAFQLAPGDDVTCTITNDDADAILTIIKDPTNNDGGDASPDDFNLTVNGNSVLSGIPNTYDSNTDLTLGETQLPGYAFVSVTGDDKCPASLNTAFQLAPGDDVTCTITNDDADAILTIIKDPTNNDGGDASPDDFNLTVNGNSVLSGIPNTYDSNTDLTLGETQLPGYAFVSVTGDDKCPASLNTAFQLAPGDDVTCTITNDDADAILTIIKDPTNNDGGDASPDDFNLTVNGNSVLSGIPNTYDSNTDLTLGETQLPGYAFVSVTGDDKCPASLNTAFQLAPGDDVTCTITNDDSQAQLTIIKDPTNNDGGDALPDDFNLTVNGNSVLSGIPNTYDSNTDLTLGETQLPGYAFVSVTGDDKCPASLNTAFQLAPGDDVTCTITNDDADAILTIIKDPTNNDGGDASPDDFNLTVNGNSVLSGVSNTYDSNTDLTLGETQLPGYAFVSVTGDDKCPASLNTAFQLAPGDDVTCTITNDDADAILTIIKDPTNNDGGDASPDDFNLTVNGNSVLSGIPNTYDSNTDLTLGETQLPGYAFVSVTGDDKCPASLNTAFQLAPGDDVTCTITNDDADAILTIIKDPTNNDGGDASPDDFNLTVNGNSVLSGIPNTYDSNTDLTLGETQLPGYAFVSVTGDDKCPASLNTAFQLAPGDDVTCTITNDDADAILTIIKDPTNNDGGDASPDDFNLTVNGNSVLSGVAYAYDSNTDLTLGETQLPGYAFVSVTGDDKCPASLNTAFQLAPGDDVTCTITNDDIAPQLKLVKDLTQDNGGEENSGDWDLSAVATNDNSRDFTDAGDSDEFHEVFANDAYHLSESGSPNYIPNAWTCLNTSQEQLSVVNDAVTLQIGEEVTCTINNDDIPPGLTLQLTLVNGIDGQATASEFVLSAEGPTGFSGIGPKTGSGPDIVAGDYDLMASGQSSYSFGNWVCSKSMVDFDTISINLGDAVLCSITIEFIDNCLDVINPDQSDSDGDGTGDACESTGGMNHWDTRPSFGVSHETRETMVVDSGFTFNGNSFTLTDNHHTPFDQESIEIGTVNTFEATVWADKDLKVQEFLFGVPEIGMGHLAEMRVEVWFDNTREIEDIKVLQESEVIDRTSLRISHQQVKCQEKDVLENCDKTSMSAVFLEPLANNVMAIKAMDFKLRDQTTYLNDGFDISGDSLNPMATKMIASPAKGEGLIEVTQNEKYSDYWSAEDGRIFEMNSFGSFKQINQTFERFQDAGNAKTRLHSDFGKIVDYEANRAVKVFDATSVESELPDSFSHNITISERLSPEMLEEMIIQEYIAQKTLDAMDKQARWN